MPQLLIEYWQKANVSTYIQPSSPITCGYQFHPFFKKCLFLHKSSLRSHKPEGQSSVRSPGFQVWAWLCHHNGSPSSALCYLYWWNMPWKCWVRQMKGGSDQTAPWFHLGSHICIFSNREEIPFSNRGFYNVSFKELKLNPSSFWSIVRNFSTETKV